MTVPSASARFRPVLLVLALLLAQSGLLGWAATRHSPGIDEVGHLAAGLHHWRTGTFDLYRVNPPLVRVVATAPLALSGVELPEVRANTGPTERPEFDLGRRFADQHQAQAFRCFFLARWACIPFALLGTVVIYVWGTALYGRTAGLLSAALWVVCPNVLAHAQMITPDSGAAGLGLAACYLFWRWVRQPGWMTALSAGAVLGLAELCKSTWLVLVPVWVVCWLVYRVRNANRVGPGWWPEGRQLAVAFVIALYVLNAGYGFEEVGRPLGRFPFVSRTLTVEAEDGARVNRFAGSLFGAIPVPVPRNYLQGIDLQKRDFEMGLRSYLRGEWRNEGWWYYYLYGLLIKTPLGTLALGGLAALSWLFRNSSTASWRDEFVLLGPGLTVLAFVSSQTGFNHHLRYVLPALPFLFVWIGRIAEYAGPYRGVWRAAVLTALLAAALSSLRVYPHSLSYFNEAVGGPLRGSEHLVDSNIDWGQDLLHLKRWLDDHPEARPLRLAYFGYVDPGAAGIEFSLPPKGPLAPADFLPSQAEELGPRPGWYAISVTLLRGCHYPIATGNGGTEFIDSPCFAYFLRFQPVATAGYSIWIYHLDEAECDRVRTELGLPPRSR